MNTKKLLVTLMLAAIMVMPLVACEGNVEPATPVATTAEVTEAPEPTEEVVEPEVTEAPEPTEEPVVEPEPTEEPISEDPNIIDGIDFTEFNNQYHEEPDGDFIYVWDVMHQQAKYDNLRIVVISDAKAEAILADGDSIVQEEENGSYNLFIYRPKKIVSMEKIGGDEVELIETTYPSIAGMLEIGYEVTGTDIEAGVKVTYEDGTQESITIYVTKDYEG